MKFRSFILLLMAAVACDRLPVEILTRPNGSTPGEAVIGAYDSTYTLKNEDIMIQNAFYLKSESLRDLFFSVWHDEIPPITDMEFAALNDTVQWVYELFEAFVEPVDEYMDMTYFVIDTSMRVTRYDSSAFAGFIAGQISFPNSQKHTMDIDGFYPAMRKHDKKTLFLNQKYREVLNFYINEWDGHSPYYTDQSYETVEEKAAFLQPGIFVHHMHWHPGYLYHSFLRISSVIFNQDCTEACILYGSSFATGGRTLYRRTGSGWEFVKKHGIWIT